MIQRIDAHWISRLRFGGGELRRDVALRALERAEKRGCVAGEVVQHCQSSGERIERHAVLRLKLSEKFDDLCPRIGHVLEPRVETVEEDHRHAGGRASFLLEAVGEDVWGRGLRRRQGTE